VACGTKVADGTLALDAVEKLETGIFETVRDPVAIYIKDC
jgi:hypothetical protein